MNSDIFVSVVIPVYNEEENLPVLINRLENVLSEFRAYEVIFVNDGSQDSSLEILHVNCKRNPSLKVVNFSRNFGHQAAISSGLEYSQGDCVIVMDGDLQDPPEVLPDFIAKWQEGYDVVYAIRKKRKENIFKRSAYFVFYRLMKKVSDIDIPLDSGDFSIMDRKIVDRLNALPERNRFVRGIRSWLGFRQTGLAYERSKRFAGKPKFTFSKLLKLAYDGLISFSHKPLSLASHMGMFITASSFVAIIALIVMKLFIGIPLQGWTSTVVVILFIGGIQLMVLGILGEYIGRIFDEVKNRPEYVVKDVVNLNELEKNE